MTKQRIVVLSGSGVSAESGLATYRAEDGTWNKYKVEEVCTEQALFKDRGKVFNFFNEAHKWCTAAEPNAAHYALAALEESFDVTILTQNVDDLHERAGSTNVLHLHGSIMWARHEVDGFKIPYEPLEASGPFRPDVVMFGEIPYHMDEAYDLCESADIGIIVGTSLQVYPAAGLVLNMPGRLFIVDPDPAVDLMGATMIKEKATTGCLKLLGMLTKHQ